MYAPDAGAAGLARTLKAIAKNPQSFYTGDIARAIQLTWQKI